MTQRWQVERVLALAPDAASATAGRRQANPATWSSTGWSAEPTEPAALWGLCQGSGKNPYRTVIELAGPAYSCSCPSRKFPCKHALGLLLLWAEGGVADGTVVPDFAAGWLASRAERAARRSPTGDTTAPAAGSPPPPNQDGDGAASALAARKRVEQRAARVAAGLDELDQWLCDRIRTGLAGLERSGYGEFESVAARMVDAQAPGVAGRLRRLAAVLASGEGWHARLLAELALLRLLVRAHRRLEQLPAGLAAAVRSHVGYPVSRESVLATAPIRDTWAVLGQRDTVEERLSSRRVWLKGSAGRLALVLSYAPAGQELDGSLLPGTSLAAELHFYPSGSRALVGAQPGPPEPLGRPAATDIETALAGYAEALAADPWTGSWPVLLGEVSPVTEGGRWLLRETSGAALPLADPYAGPPWRLLATSGGAPVTIAGEWSAAGLTPLSVIRGSDLVRL